MRAYSRSFFDRFSLLSWISNFRFKRLFPCSLEAILFAIFTLWLTSILMGCGSGVVITGTNSLVISPGALDFGDVSLGQSSVRTIVVSNTGRTTVSISQINFSSSAFSIVNADSFPISIAGGSSHTISIGFNPTIATDYSAETVVADSAAKPLAKVAIHGRGRNSTQLTAQISVSVSKLDFGSVTVGSSTIQALTLTSAGTSPVTIGSATISGTGFAVVGGNFPATLNPNQSLTLQVQFSPTTTGATSGQLTIGSDPVTNNTTTVLLTGSGAITMLPQLTLSTGALSFGSVTVNTSTTQTVTLTSTGTAPVTVTSATISGARFSLAVVSLPATLGPNQSLILQIQFSPTAMGAANGQLTIISDSSTASTAAIALSGTGAAAPSPQLAVEGASLSFGDVAVNSAVSKSLTLTSTGSSAVTVNAANVIGTAYTIVAQSFPVVLSPTQSLTLQVQFKPTAAEALKGQLNISSNSTTGNTAVVTLSGTGTAANPQLTLNATSLNFGSVAVNTTTTLTLTLTSSGTTPVTVNSASVAGAGFTILGASFPLTLSPTQTIVLSLQFKPTTAGATTGQLTISNNSTTGGIAQVALSGTGTVVSHEVDLSWNPPSSSPVPVAGYNIYRSAESGSFMLVNPSPTLSSSYVDRTVVSGITYSYVVKSVGSGGVESDASNGVTVAIP